MKKIIFFLFLIPILSFGQNNNLGAESITNLKASYIDSPFNQEYHEGFIVDENNADANNVRAIQPALDGTIWIATKGGIYQKKVNSREWHLVVMGEDQGPAYDVEIDKDQNVWMATWNGVYRYRRGSIEKMGGPRAPLAKIVSAKEGG